ncbi:hypothetical protein Hanom_Chr03g00269121 [Helianthus anomalus]
MSGERTSSEILTTVLGDLNLRREIVTMLGLNFYVFINTHISWHNIFLINNNVVADKVMFILHEQ